ncbi:hypothetical protein E4T42_01421 [Aureobasidium subglaciale]|nr:hypothetical protein E4T42_01421 [Aureobasidium subglaciale]
MDNLDFTHADNLLAYGDYTDPRHNHSYSSSSSLASQQQWAFTLDSLDPTMAHQSLQPQHQHQHHHHQHQHQHQIEQPVSQHVDYKYDVNQIDQKQHLDYNVNQHDQKTYESHNLPAPVQPNAMHLGYTQQQMNQAAALDPQWHFQFPAQQAFSQDATLDRTYDASYAMPMHQATPQYMPVSAENNMAMNSTAYMTMAGPMESMNVLSYPLNDYQNELLAFQMGMAANTNVQSSLPSNSPTGSYLEIRSLSSSDNGWTAVDFPVSRHSLGSYVEANNNAIFNPSQTLHIRSASDSSNDDASSAQLSSSYEEIPFPLFSPVSDGFSAGDYVQHRSHHTRNFSSDYEHDYSSHSTSSSPLASPADGTRPSTSQAVQTSTISSNASSPVSPPVRKRKTPTNALAKTTKSAIKKATPPARKDGAPEKRVGKRKGPLRADQRQQAHEIRKLRACLRCKFLKKTCDKGNPCGGCRPSHARLWQVPCTRIDIKDIGFFMKDWKADYERHVNLGVSAANIKGFSPNERTVYITHGYGYLLPINVREVYVRDDSCFNIDWSEKINDPIQFESHTSKLSTGMEGVSASSLSDYLDCHLDNGFESFVDGYFEGTPFLTEMLKTAYHYWAKSKSPVIRKALKLVLAYNLTLHITMIEGLSEEEASVGKIEDEDSKFCGKTIAPGMINFQVKIALADMWRELQKDVLEELSALYSSVYSGEKLKNWPAIFMLAAILLAVWEEMQFDAHYRTPDEIAVNQFCNDMESTPVGVIVGLFQAISQKLPNFMDWDTRSHHQLLNSDPAICEALTEVKQHVTKHEKYLRSRSDAKFDRNDFDCLSNKFLARLVIRAN